MPESVRVVDVAGKTVYLVGTAHVSKQSVEDVRTTIDAVGPGSVAVELCEPRYKAMTDKEAWKSMNIFKVIKEKKALFLLAQLIMSAFYRRLGKKLGVQPGAEMLEAISEAEKTGAELVLADRRIEVTLRRVWGYLGFWNKLKLMNHLLGSLLFGEEIDDEMIEKIKAADQLESVMEEFSAKFPQVKERLITERDIYLAQKIRQAPGEKVVAVVGAGHVAGIMEHIQEKEPIEHLDETPPRSVVPVLLKWGIPAAIIGLFVYGFFKEGAAHSVENVYIWVLVNGVLSALGAAAALGHPLAVAAAFVGAPVTSLNPMMAAGWVAGLVQAWVRTPKVSDFEALAKDEPSLKGFWVNPVARVLLVVCLANLGSTLGTVIAGAWLGARTV